jgi:hypothetical protein
MDSFLACWFLALTWPVLALDPLALDLSQAGIEPSRQGVEEFLESLRLTPAREARIRKLLADLGSTRFRVRDRAMAELRGLPYAPDALLREAAGKDLETQRRVDRLRAQSRFAECESRSLLAARFIEEQRLKGLAPLLLDLMPQWQDTYLLQAVVRAAAVSAERRDAEALRRAMGRGRAEQVRAAAATAVAAALGRDAEKELTPFLTDASPRVRLAAATALLDQGNRKSLGTLVSLLDAEPNEVREAAATVLHAVTDKQFGYASYDEPKRRAEAVALWRAWLVEHGATAKLDLPIRPRRIIRGRILIAVYAEKVLRDIDLRTGKTVFEAKGFTYPWGCHATPEGRRLAVDYQRGFVVEYDSQGKECWKHNVPGQPTNVERLANGRTLIALPSPGMLVELDRAGKVAWKMPLAGGPSTAHRLPNGHTLVSLCFMGKVVEIDPQGKVVWQATEGLRSPHTVQQLDNGNVLVCDFGNPSVVEFNRSGKIVWSKRGLNNPAQAQRLPNGHTLISETNHLTEVDAQGKLVRQLNVSRSRFFAY